MKNISLILCVISFFLTTACFLTVLPKRGALENTMKNILVFASLITLSYTFVLFTQDAEKARIAYSLKSLFTSWLLALLLLYSARFIHKYDGKYKSNRLVQYVVISALAVNSLIMILNLFRPYATEVLQHSFGGEVFYMVKPLPLYYFHIFFVCALILLNCLLFYRSYLIVSRVYWQRYGVLITSFFALLAIKLFMIVTGMYVDVSVLAYGISAFHIFSVHFHPSRFPSEINSLLIESYSNGIVVFDSKYQLVLYNKKSSELFSLSRDMLKTLSFEEFAERHSLHSVLQTEDDGFFYNMEKDGTRLYFFVRCSRIFDRKGLFVGSYLIFEDETVQRTLLGQKRFLTQHDHLTGILNRSAFAAETEALLRNNPETAYVFIQFDIDNFRIINQLFGSRAGNALLQAIAEYLKGYVKSGTYARLEADHFAICVPESNLCLEELSDGISKCVNRIGINLQLRASFGIYRIEDKTIPVEQMYDMAVMASKAVKGNYWEYYAYYDDKMSDIILHEQEIIGEMEYALRNNQFEVLLQPQYNYTTGNIVGAETLVRWNHPEKGIIMPKSFIPIFEKNGFIVQLDQYIWEYACKLLHKWSEEDSRLNSLPLSVNISRIDFYRMDLCATMKQLAEKYDLDPKLLRLEVTESACMGNPEHMINIIKELQSYGFIVEMDDFGSGYSSLNILKSMPVNVLKLDMKFLSGDGDYNKGCSILRSIVHMAKAIDLSIIAEGVETREQADFLNNIGCEIMQGYYYSYPLRVHEYEREVKENHLKKDIDSDRITK